MLEGFGAAHDADIVLPWLRPGSVVVDVGCRGGTTTLAFGTAAHPITVVGVDADDRLVAQARLAARRASVSTVEFLVGAPGRLPFAESTVDVLHARDVLGFVADPSEVLAEFARVLRPGGRLAVAAADWSKAKLRPRTTNVDAALRGRNLVWQRQGANPFAGRRAEEWVARAGFGDVRARVRFRQGLAYRALAAQVEAELAAAVRTPEGARDAQLASAARSAWMWAKAGGGDFEQCWTEVTATAP